MARTTCQCGTEVIVGRDEDDSLVHVDVNPELPPTEAARYVLIEATDDVESTRFRQVPGDWPGEAYVDHKFDCLHFGNGL